MVEGAGELLDGSRIRAIQFEFGGTAMDSRVFLRDFFHLLSPQYALHRLLPNGLWPMPTCRE